MALSFSTVNITGSDQPEMVWLGEVTPNLFNALETTPLLGRTFAPGDGTTGSANVAVIGESLWRDRFGSSADVIGSDIRLDEAVHTVVGVLPRSFDFIRGDVDVWRPNDFETRRDDRDNRVITMAAYLTPGITIAQARDDLEAVHARLRQQFPTDHEGMEVRLLSMRQFFPGPADRALVMMLLGVVLLVLMVACVNVASLYLAKTEGRRREISIRTALGAGRWRLVRQLLTETTVLALAAGALGLLLAVPGVAFFRAAMPAELPASLTVPEWNGAVALFGLAIAFLSGLAFGLVPVAQALRTRDHHVLDTSRGGTASRRRKRLRGAFVVGELALALAILVGVASMTDLLSTRLSRNPGFDGAGLLTAQIQLPSYRYETPDALRTVTRDLHRELATLGGVRTAALASVIPRMQGVPDESFHIEGRPTPAPDEMPRARVVSASPEYFEALSIGLVRGRGFERGDRDGAPPVAVVSQRLVDRFFDGEDPLNRSIVVDSVGYAIIGVVGDVALARLDGLLPPRASIYFSLDQRPVRRVMTVLKAEGNDPHLVARPLQEAVWRVDADQPVARVLSMEEHVDLILAGPIVVTQLMLAVGLLALVLAAIGTYGVMAFTVTQEQRDTGIRMALGARPTRVLSRMAGRGLRLTLLGLLAGLPLSIVLVQWISTVMNDPEEFGPVAAGQIGIAPAPLVAAFSLLALVGVLASFLPARRATAVDPARVLGQE
jgi:putative ABC transport system permease protein